MNIITFVFDALFPPRTTERIVRKIIPNTIPSKYLPHCHRNTFCLSNYSDPAIQALITENKYHHNPAASKYLADLLVTWLMTQTLPVVLIPIPLSKKRERERGYNQVTEILRHIEPTHNLSIDNVSLQRTRHTMPQTSLQRTKRLTNLNAAFACDIEKINSYENCTLVLVDDVTTTGATMAAASAALKTNLHPSAKLICLALAH